MIIMRRYIYISILMIVSNVVFGQESQPTLASPQTKTQAKYIKEDRKKGLRIFNAEDLMLYNGKHK